LPSRFVLLLGAALGAVAVIPISAIGQPAPTAAFVSREGRFAADFPADPVPGRAGRDTWAGHMEEGSFELEGGGLRLRVEFHDVPRMAAMMLPRSVILDLAKDSLLSDVNARNASTTKASLHGHPGLALRYEPGNRPGVVEEARIFLVGGRLYVAFAGAQDVEAQRETAARFLASFDAWEPGDSVASTGGETGTGL